VFQRELKGNSRRPRREEPTTFENILKKRGAHGHKKTDEPSAGGKGKRRKEYRGKEARDARFEGRKLLIRLSYKGSFHWRTRTSEVASELRHRKKKHTKLRVKSPTGRKGYFS